MFPTTKFLTRDPRAHELADVTRSRSTDGKIFTLGFAPNTFRPGTGFSFGMLVFNPLQGSTQEMGDRFRGMNVTVKLDDGSTFKAPVFAAPKLPFNRFTGFGLVNADKATKAVKSGEDD